jgi:predicted acyl esterase
VSSSDTDADLFAIVRKLDASGDEVTFQGSIQPGFPAAYGWLRVSHRKLDPARSKPYRPFHPHDELQKLTPGEIVPVELEIWPTSVVFEPGERLVLEIAAHDEPRIAPFLHDDPRDRICAKTVTLHTGGRFDSHLLLPVIPSASRERVGPAQRVGATLLEHVAVSQADSREIPAQDALDGLVRAARCAGRSVS